MMLVALSLNVRPQALCSSLLIPAVALYLSGRHHAYNLLLILRYCAIIDKNIYSERGSIVYE